MSVLRVRACKLGWLMYVCVRACVFFCAHAVHVSVCQRVCACICARAHAFFLFFFFFNNCIVPLGFLPWEIRVAFSGESQLRRGRASQPTVHAACFSFHNPPNPDIGPQDL